MQLSECPGLSCLPDRRSGGMRVNQERCKGCLWSRRGMRSSYCPCEGAVDVFLCDTPVGHPTPALQIASDGTW